MVDAYAAYDKLEGIKRALCWCHLRRYMIESIALDQNGKELSGSMGMVGRNYCDQLLAVERKIANLSPSEKYHQRQVLSQPILEAFFSWVDETMKKHTTNTALTKALTYAKNQKEGLMTFLEDGRIPIYNNDAERSIKSIAVGRRAWLFADTPKGAQASALLYSIVETAKLYPFDIYQYLNYLLEKMPFIDFESFPEAIDHFLPWSKDLPDICKKMPDVNTKNSKPVD